MHPRTAPQPAPNSEDIAPPPTVKTAAPPSKPEPDVRPLTPRQRDVMRAYMQAHCHTGQASKIQGCHRETIWAVRTSPAGKAYLAELEQAAVDAMVQARAAQLLAPLLGL